MALLWVFFPPLLLWPLGPPSIPIQGLMESLPPVAELSACHASGPPENDKRAFVCKHLASSSGAIHHGKGGGRQTAGGREEVPPAEEASSPRSPPLAGPKWLLSPEMSPVWGQVGQLGGRAPGGMEAGWMLWAPLPCPGAPSWQLRGL